MNEMICKGAANDYDDIIDFGNLVFRLDFKSLLPKLYDGHPEKAQCHHLAKEGGRIKAMVGNFPLSLQAAGKSLKAYGIGTVSVHPYSRGKGYMKVLMKNAVAEAKQNDGDFMVLSGQRQRYEHFGFTRCGVQLRFDYNQSNKRHLKEYSAEGIELISLKEKPEYVKPCLDIYRRQGVFAGRTTEDFVEVASSWDAIPYGILADGVLIGYCCFIPESGTVEEMVLSDASKTVPVVFKLLERVKNDLVVLMAPSQADCIREMYHTCERSQILNNACINVLSYPNVIEAFLTLKGQIEGIIDGSYVIDVHEVGRYQIKVENGAVTVAETSEQWDLSLDHIAMMCRLFDPMTAYLPGPEMSAVEKSWFPIPVYFPHMDNV